MMPYTAIFLAAYVWAFFISEWKVFKKSKDSLSHSSSTDQETLRKLTAGMLVIQFLSFAIAFVEPLQFSASSRHFLFWIGVLLLVGASILRRHCFRMLDDYFTIDIRAHPEQSVIDRGAYAFVRHPSYTAAIMMFVGVGMALGSWASLLLLSVASIVLYMCRIVVEERVLEEVLGERYRMYMRGRKRLIPYVY